MQYQQKQRGIIVIIIIDIMDESQISWNDQAITGKIIVIMIDFDDEQAIVKAIIDDMMKKIIQW